MKKLVLIFLMVLIVKVGIALTLSELDIDEQNLVEDLVISLDAEVNEMNFEDFEGIKYELIYETTEYIIIRINGVFYIVEKE